MNNKYWDRIMGKVIEWENKQISIDADADLNQTLNSYGKVGREVVSINRRYDGNWLLCTLISLKRQKHP